MATTSSNSPSILPSFRPITPYSLYLMQVQGTIDAVRQNNQGLSYYPPHFGGISGQRKTLEEQVALQVIDFRIPK